ncbi:ABC transporter permease [Actinocorallia lasiicapitis]
MNPTIASMTLRGMLGRRRVILLFLAPLILLGLSLFLRAGDHNTLDVEVGVLQGFALATLLPLLAVIAGTGVIGPEIDEGQIIYVLTKPISRSSVIFTKFLCALLLTTVFAVFPTILAAIILDANPELPFAFGLGTFLGAIAYSALFVALAVYSRNAVVIGMIYAMVWEALLGSFAPGAKTLSVQQWSLRVVDQFTTTQSITPDISLPTALILLTLATATGLILATTKLSKLTIASSEG